jgi:hypothetical protein
VWQALPLATFAAIPSIDMEVMMGISSNQGHSATQTEERFRGIAFENCILKID